MICTAIAGVNATLFAEYKVPNNEPHIFTPIHQWVQTQKERLFAETKQQSNELDAVNDAITTTTDDMNAVTSAGQITSKPKNNHNDNISELLRIAKGHR